MGSDGTVEDRENGLIGWATGGKPLAPGAGKLLESWSAGLIVWIECALGLAEYYALANIADVTTFYLFGGSCELDIVRGVARRLLSGCAVGLGLAYTNACFHRMTVIAFLARLGLSNGHSLASCDASSARRVAVAVVFQVLLVAGVLHLSSSSVSLGAFRSWGLAKSIDAGLMVPLHEELVFRAGLGLRLSNRFPRHPLYCCAASSAAFSLVHLGRGASLGWKYALLQCAVALPAGLAWSLAFAARGSIVETATAHMAHNVAGILVLSGGGGSSSNVIAGVAPSAVQQTLLASMAAAGFYGLCARADARTLLKGTWNWDKKRKKYCWVPY